jgi:hypothetical protein
MAEVLGVVASGIALGQLADRIIHSIRRLNEFWQSVRDAPRDLKNIVEELEMLGETLLELQNGLGRDRKGIELQGTAAAKCLRYCNKIAIELENTILELQQGLDSKRAGRHWAAIKAAFRKGAVQDLQQRLERAKSMLVLAINCYSL